VGMSTVGKAMTGHYNANTAGAGRHQYTQCVRLMFGNDNYGHQIGSNDRHRRK
jgi:hypothetical protein